MHRVLGHRSSIDQCRETEAVVKQPPRQALDTDAGGLTQLPQLGGQEDINPLIFRI